MKSLRETAVNIFSTSFHKKMRGSPQHFFCDKNKILVGRFWLLEKTNHIGFKPKCISGLHSLAGVHLLGAPETSASANPGQDKMQNVSRI